MKLPEKFSFRVSAYCGFTHTATLNQNHQYDIKWARGYPEKLGKIPVKFFLPQDIDWMVEGRYWIIVDYNPEQKKQEVDLPDVFSFQYVNEQQVYKATWNGLMYSVDCSTPFGFGHALYDREIVNDIVKNGLWKILPKKSLTAEQQRENKRLREEIAALDSSIKLNEQDIEHKKRLIASYEQRKGDLLKKIVEE